MSPRAKKPTKLKIIEGNPGKRKLPENEPEPTSRAQPPDWVADDPVAKAEWERLSPELEGLGLLTGIDAAAFGIYCDAFARFAKLRQEVIDKGEILTGKTNGGAYISPHLSAMRGERDVLFRAIGLMGFSPADRSRIQLPGKATEGSEVIEKLLNRRRGK